MSRIVGVSLARGTGARGCGRGFGGSRRRRWWWSAEAGGGWIAIAIAIAGAWSAVEQEGRHRLLRR